MVIQCHTAAHARARNVYPPCMLCTLPSPTCYANLSPPLLPAVQATLMCLAICSTPLLPQQVHLSPPTLLNGAAHSCGLHPPQLRPQAADDQIMQGHEAQTDKHDHNPSVTASGCLQHWLSDNLVTNHLLKTMLVSSKSCHCAANEPQPRGHSVQPAPAVQTSHQTNDRCQNSEK